MIDREYDKVRVYLCLTITSYPVVEQILRHDTFCKFKKCFLHIKKMLTTCSCTWLTGNMTMCVFTFVRISTVTSLWDKFGDKALCASFAHLKKMCTTSTFSGDILKRVYEIMLQIGWQYQDEEGRGNHSNIFLFCDSGKVARSLHRRNWHPAPRVGPQGAELIYKLVIVANFC